MREIEYRAWYYDKDYPEFSHMTFVCSIDFVKRKAKIGVLENVYKFDQIELMQYTGLKDNNGVKIFEGDIVKSVYGEIYDVFFTSGGFKLINSENEFQLDSSHTASIEVIGNIYKNKELLKYE